MSKPFPTELFEEALEYGGVIDIDDGRLVIITDQLPEELLERLEQALADFTEDGDETYLQ